MIKASHKEEFRNSGIAAPEHSVGERLQETCRRWDPSSYSGAPSLRRHRQVGKLTVGHGHKQLDTLFLLLTFCLCLILDRLLKSLVHDMTAVWPKSLVQKVKEWIWKCQHKVTGPFYVSALQIPPSGYLSPSWIFIIVCLDISCIVTYSVSVGSGILGLDIL